MLRGYVNQETFKTGDGTRNVSHEFAKKGFITIAPDFLGYGGSDEEAGNIFETRFQTYTTVLALINYFENNPYLTTESDKFKIGKLFLWSHSNGGHIALTILEISGKNYPSTLWAPVSKPFPYSVLFYTDQSEDGGVLIRKELARFEEVNDPVKYSLTNYLDQITAPLLVQQGASDTSVPKNWTDEFVDKLRKNKIDVNYIVYPSADHNMRPNWDTVVNRNLSFFAKNLK